jgi:predicted nucleotide-binding protein (sugar kinase/HSP70/actin superfamily)
MATCPMNKTPLTTPSQNEGLTLAQSHPTLDAHKDGIFFMREIQAIQECTVDKAEHERAVKEARFEGQKQGALLWQDEVERLKKELEETKSTIIKHDTAMYDIAFNRGVVEGERRAIERVYDKIINFWDCGYIDGDTMDLLKERLGLDGGEEEKK